MDFFGAQDAARSGTFRLVVLFAFAVVSLVVVTNLMLMFFLGMVDATQIATPAGVMSHFDWGNFLAIGGGVALVIAAGSLYKLIALSRGGSAVAEALGGRIIAQDTADPSHRRLLNVVEEMAIASGTPVPPVYLLEREPGINAFAAGLTPANAVIGLTRGAAEQLSRDQLQGVIAHEFSHIVNGDMRLNIRLAGVLHGILLIGLIGYHLLHAGGRGRSRSSRGSGGFLVLGLGLMAVGFGGTFFSNLIKASVSRQREFLADASAVQFTRNPHGIAGALRRIGGARAHGLLGHPDAPEMSHAYFAQGVRSFLGRLSATHPPLEERILRVDPGWDGRFESGPVSGDQTGGTDELAGLGGAGRMEDGGWTTGMRRGEGGPAASERAAGFASPEEIGRYSEAELVAEQAVTQIGRPNEAHLRYAESLIGTLPAALHWAAREPYGARALVYAMLLGRDTKVRRRQLGYLDSEAERGLREYTEHLHTSLGHARREHLLPLIDLCMPALRQLSQEQYHGFKSKLEALIRMDARIDLFEWCLSRILVFGLGPDFGDRRHARSSYNACSELKQECALVFSLLSRAQGRRGAQAPAAFQAARTAIGIPDLEPATRTQIHHRAIDKALERLGRLRPQAKRAFLKACAASVLADERIEPSELEVVRAVGAVVDCPVPPILVPKQALENELTAPIHQHSRQG